MFVEGVFCSFLYIFFECCADVRRGSVCVLHCCQFSCIYYIVFLYIPLQVWFPNGRVRATAQEVLDKMGAAFWECTAWLAGDRLQGAIDRPTLQGLLISMGSVNTIAKRRLPGVIVAPPTSPQVQNEFNCPHTMNVLLPLMFIKYCSVSNKDIVADFMCGSGSCAVAAAYYGRHSISVDIDASMVRFFCHYQFCCHNSLCISKYR